jgi:hypothetical protein
MRCKNSRLSNVEHNVIGHFGAHAETFSRHICNNINVIVNPSLYFTKHHIFMFNFTIILYRIIIEMVALGYTGASISVITC